LNTISVINVVRRRLPNCGACPCPNKSPLFGRDVSALLPRLQPAPADPSKEWQSDLPSCTGRPDLCAQELAWLPCQRADRADRPPNSDGYPQSWNFGKTPPAARTLAVEPSDRRRKGGRLRIPSLTRCINGSSRHTPPASDAHRRPRNCRWQSESVPV